MNGLRQIFVVSALNFRGLRERIWPSLVIITGVGCVVAVLVSVLSLTVGITRSYTVNLSPTRTIVLAMGTATERGSSLTHEAVNFAIDLPDIRKTADGSPLADGEVVASLPADKKGSGLNATIALRGLGPKGLLMHPNLHIVAGRMFRAGLAEAIVGMAAQQQFSDVEIGDTVTLQHGRWKIVGAFKADGDIIEGQIIADANTLMPAIGRKSYNSVIADLVSPDRFGAFKAALTTNPSMQMTAERQSQYLARTTQRFASLFNTVAYVIGGIMAVGAIFGTINTLYTAVGARSREIATLRALGFGEVPVAVSVVLEAIFLSVVGAVGGSAAAWLLFDGKHKVLGTSVFSLSIGPSLVGFGILWAVAIALVGAALPSFRAARLPIVVALRAL